MPQAVIEVNAVAGSDDDLPINTVVQLSNADIGGETTYAWTVMDQPEGAADALSNPAIENPTITPKKEGTYRLRLVVNAGGGDEKIGYATLGIRHLRTFELEPAAGELLETDGVRGWAKFANRLFRRAMNGITDANLVACVNTAVGALAVGTVVKIVDQNTIKTGLPGEERLPGATAVSAASHYNVSGTLGVVILSPSGGAITTGKVAIVRVFGLSEIAVAGVPTLNDPVYVDNAGLPSLTPGTFRRAIGRVVQVSGGNFRWVVEGGWVRKGINTKQMHLAGRTVGANWSIAGGGWLESTGAGSFMTAFEMERGDKIVDIRFERYGNASADFTGINFLVLGAGTDTNIATHSLTNPAAAWVTESMPAVTATELGAEQSLHAEFVGNAAGLRVGTVSIDYIPALQAKA